MCQLSMELCLIFPRDLLAVRVCYHVQLSRWSTLQPGSSTTLPSPNGERKHGYCQVGCVGLRGIKETHTFGKPLPQSWQWDGFV